MNAHRERVSLNVVTVDISTHKVRDIFEELTSWSDKYRFDAQMVPLPTSSGYSTTHQIHGLVVCFESPPDPETLSGLLAQLTPIKREKTSACVFSHIDAALEESLLFHFDHVVFGREKNSLKWACRWHVESDQIDITPHCYGESRYNIIDACRYHLSPQPTGGVILIHGGFWRPQFRRDMVFGIASDLARLGLMAWAVEYTPSGVGPPFACVHDVLRAIDTVYGSADALQVPPDNIALLGHSVGGYLALVAAAISDQPIKHVWALAPVADLGLALAQDLGNGAVRELLQTNALHKRILREYCPASMNAPSCAITIFHGTDDEIVPLNQSRSYLEAHGHLTDRISLIPIANVGHMDLTNEFSEPWCRIRDEIVMQLGSGDPQLR